MNSVEDDGVDVLRYHFRNDDGEYWNNPDNVGFLRDWASDIRHQSGESNDADRLDGIANELATLREKLTQLAPTPLDTVSRLQREMGERCPRKRGDDCVYPECDCDRPV